MLTTCTQIRPLDPTVPESPAWLVAAEWALCPRCASTLTGKSVKRMPDPD